MSKELTDRQKEIFDFICSFREENHYAPSYREIAENFGMQSVFGVKRHLDALIKKGYLQKADKLGRTMKPVSREFEEEAASDVAPEGTIRVPIVGRVAAGMPIAREENIEGNIVIDTGRVKNRHDCFALTVKGESMVNAGIFDGDLVVVIPQQDAKNDDIVVAVVDGEVTVKRYLKVGGKILLLPANERFAPIEVVPDENYAMIGKVVAVLRWYH